MNKKIKILRIIARLNVGGPAIHTILLAGGLNKDEFDSLLVTGTVETNEGDMQYYALEKSVYPMIIPQLQRKINFIKDFIAFIKIYALIKKEMPDIIHTHTAKAGTLGRLAGILYNLSRQRNRCKLIHTFHGTVLEGYFGKAKTRFFIWIERMLARFTHRIIAVGKTLKDELLKLKIGTPEKICVIYLGLELDKLLSLVPQNSNSKLKVGIVGRLALIKNQRLFLDTIKFLSKNYNLSPASLRFFIIGDGELRQELEKYASSLGINEFVEFCGWHSDTVKIYDSLDIVVLTSLNEGTPVSLIEAMAASKPIIATDVGGVRDLFTKEQNYGLAATDRIRIYDNGILCRSNDVEGLAEALNLLFNHSNLKTNMGDAGRNFVREIFFKERLIKDMEMLYNELSKRSSS